MIEYVSLGIFLSTILLYASWLTILVMPKRKDVYRDFHPGVSIIIPAHNEEKTICKSVKSLLDADYAGKKEIIIVDDGSTDGTRNALSDILKNHGNVRLIDVAHGGKSNAINLGTRHARHGVVVVMDADSTIGEDSLKEIVRPLSDPKIGAVSGAIRARTDMNPLTWFQDFEYITSSGWRYISGKIDMPSVVPGLVAYRKDAFACVGGFSRDTLTEDFDIALKLRKAGYKTKIVTTATVYTDVPKTVMGLVGQRVRWGRGTIQTIRKHSDLLFSRKGGALGSYVLPTQMFWYFFSFFYVPTMMYRLFGDYLKYFVLQNNILSLESAKYFLSWFSAYGILETIQNVLSGRYSMDLNLTIMLASFLLSLVYSILLVSKFSKPSIRHALVFFFFFPYAILTLAVQAFVLLTEAVSTSRGTNVWEKNM